MIVWPGLRRSVSAISRLFNSAAFDAPLTHTAVPTRAAPGTTGTFVRATTATWPNNDGYLVTGVAGEIGFVGARRVYNRVPNSETLTAAAGWGLSNITTPGSATAVAPDGTTTAWILTASGATGQWYKQITGLVPNGSGLSHIWLRRNTGTGTVGLFTSAGAFAGDLAITSEWAQYSLKTTTTAGGTSYIGIQITTSGDKVEVWHPQFEDVTAQTTQTAGEYVSVGVESAPYYHGSFVDGVKCFPTDLAGNPIPSTTMLGYQAQGARTNLCLQSQTFGTTWAQTNVTVSSDAAIAPDGTSTADSVLETVTAGGHAPRQSITTTAAAWTFSVYAKPNGRTWLLLDANAFGGGAYFNLSGDGSVGTLTTSGITATISSEINGWYRCSITKTATAVTDQFSVFFATGDGVFSYAGDITKGFYLWGAQVELGSSASSYTATAATAVTRNADVLTYSSAGNFSNTAGWGYAEVKYAASTATSGAILSKDNTSILLYVNTDTSELRSYDGTSVITAAGDSFSSNVVPVGLTWGGSTRLVSVGGQTTSGAYDGTWAAGDIGVGCYNTGTTQWNGTIRNVRIGQRQLSASELGAITA